MADIADKIEKKIEDHIENMDMSVDIHAASAQSAVAWANRTRMTWVALIALITLNACLFFVTDANRIDKLGIALSWFDLAMGSIIMTFFGVKAWAGVKGK